ncbi:MAG: hypothetical protein Q8R88_14115, partial [Desulfoprunum sp.]|nr:hypothetical protein [Desulfoprunum sp.]
MATIDFLKAGEPVERYDDAAIDEYVEGQKVEIIKAADDLGMPQLYTAIAGAMAEENNSYLEHVLRDDVIDKYALSGLTAADLVGITESSLLG